MAPANVLVRRHVAAGLVALVATLWLAASGTVAWAQTTEPAPSAPSAPQHKPTESSSSEAEAPEPTEPPPGKSPTTSPEGTSGPAATAPSTPAATASAAPDAAAPTAAPTQRPRTPTLPGIAPAASGGNQEPVSWIIAGFVLVAGVILLRWTRRREPAAPVIAVSPDHPASPAETLAALEQVGEALIDAGYSVSSVRAVLLDVAAVNGAPGTEVVVFPTALFVSTRGMGEVRTGAVSSGHDRLNFSQIDALSEVVARARSGTLAPAQVSDQLRQVRELPEPYPGWQRVLAYVLLSTALSVLLGASWGGVALAAILGAGVGRVLLVTEHVARQYRALVTVGTSFVVSVVVLTATSIGLDPGVLPSLVAPLVTFLPGALLTTGFIELATGQMMAGAGRLAAGAMQLLLLAAGTVAGAALVGVPQLDLSSARDPLGPLAPWLAVGMFGFALMIHQGGRRRALGWILLVLYVAYGAQVIGDLFLGGVLSAFVGAAAMTPVAILASRHPSGPAAFVSFLPAFYLLVPGALGLVGVTSLLDGDVTGLGTLLTTASTMVAIALGVLVGSVLSSRLQHAHSLLL